MEGDLKEWPILRILAPLPIGTHPVTSGTTTVQAKGAIQ